MNASTIWSIALWMDIACNPWRRRNSAPHLRPACTQERWRAGWSRQDNSPGGTWFAGRRDTLHGCQNGQGATFAAPRRWYQCDVAVYAPQGNAQSAPERGASSAGAFSLNSRTQHSMRSAASSTSSPRRRGTPMRTAAKRRGRTRRGRNLPIRTTSFRWTGSPLAPPSPARSADTPSTASQPFC